MMWGLLGFFLVGAIYINIVHTILKVCEFLSRVFVGINCVSAEMSIGEGGEIDVHTYYQLKDYCGDDMPHPVYSITNKLWISYIQRAFSADPMWMIASFEAEYKAELRVRTTEGSISSPGYPDNYPRHLARSWSIVAPEGTP